MTHTLTPEWTPYILLLACCIFIVWLVTRRA